MMWYLLNIYSTKFGEFWGIFKNVGIPSQNSPPPRSIQHLRKSATASSVILLLIHNTYAAHNALWYPIPVLGCEALTINKSELVRPGFWQNSVHNMFWVHSIFYVHSIYLITNAPHMLLQLEYKTNWDTEQSSFKFC